MAGKARIEVADVGDGLATMRGKAPGGRRTDAPNLIGRHPDEPVVIGDRVGQVAHPIEFWNALGDVVGQFGEGLGAPEPDAGRDADPSSYRLAKVAGIGNQVAPREAGQVKEALVDRVDFNIRAERAIHLVHAGGYVAIEGVVRREHGDAFAPAQVADHEIRGAHADTERLGLIAQPSLFDSTITGRFANRPSNTRSQEQ
jgi:hypothetical protein